MVIVDSTVWIDLLNVFPSPEAAWLAREIPKRRLGLTDLILCEVLQGFHSESMFREVARDLDQFIVLDSGGIEIAVASARNYRFLRSRGITIRKTIDCLIATFCIAQGHTLLHRDRDFDPFEEHLGLRVLHP
jgi:predicted nucleic acid-binding protein